MSDGRNRVVVVGGGVIGACAAYYLNKDGWKVTIIERAGFGQGSSWANCGFVSPCHVLPLTEPGAVWKAIKALGRPRSPLYIRLRFDPALWRWLWNFARRCNERCMLEAAQARHPLLQSTMQLLRQLLEEEQIECEWQYRGLLYVYKTRQEMEEFAETDAMLSKKFGLKARRYDGEDVVRFEPALKEQEMAGGWYYEDDAHLRPDLLMNELKRVLQQRGVEIKENCPMKDLEADGRVARAVITPSGKLEAEAVLIATGAWTPQLAGPLRCYVPIQPGKGYSITMDRPDPCPQVPMIFPEVRVAVTPFRTTFRLGSTMEFSGYDETLNPKRLEFIKWGASQYLKSPYTERVHDQWWGWRPMTWDGVPVIDRLPAFDNVWIAAGHNMVGLSMCAGTGKLVAELIGNRTPHIDPAPYRIQRFLS